MTAGCVCEVLVQDEDLSLLIYRAEHSFDELDDFEKWRVNRYLDGYMSMSEQDLLVYRQISETGDDAAFEEDMREYMSLPMYREYWRHSESRHGTEFRNFVNTIIDEVDSSVN